MNSEFYTNLAKMFYAVAMADRTITVEEKKKIIKLTENYFSIDLANENSSEIIYKELRDLIGFGQTAEVAFEQFKDYVKKNPQLFKLELKEKILQAAHEIANAFSSKNKSELILLARLEHFFNGLNS